MYSGYRHGHMTHKHLWLPRIPWFGGGKACRFVKSHNKHKTTQQMIMLLAPSFLE